MQLVHSAELEDWRRTAAERAEEHESRARRTCYSSVQVC